MSHFPESGPLYFATKFNALRSECGGRGGIRSKGMLYVMSWNYELLVPSIFLYPFSTRAPLTIQIFQDCESAFTRQSFQKTKLNCSVYTHSQSSLSHFPRFKTHFSTVITAHTQPVQYGRYEDVDLHQFVVISRVVHLSQQYGAITSVRKYTGIVS